MADRTEATERTVVLKQLRRKATRIAAVARLCEMFEPLVKAQARAHWHTKAEIDDLEQVARVGMLEACDSFVKVAKVKKWNDGVFPTYALWCIRNALSKHSETNEHLVRLPAWMHRRLPKLRKARARLAQELLREPTYEELAARLKMPLRAVETMLVYEEAPKDLPAWISGDEYNMRPPQGKHGVTPHGRKKKVYFG